MGSWEENVRQFLLEEEEDDDELFFVILPAIIPYLSEEKRPIHTSSLTGAKKVKEILEGHESWCKSEFRMEKEIFKATSNFLRRENLLRDTRGVSVEEQLGMFMYMISHNASNQMLQKAFQHSGETIHRKISEVFEIVPILTQRFVKLPSSVQTHARIATDSRFMPFFQNCLGAIDGTHVPITIAEDRAPPYRNRKGTLSHNVMVVCDFDLNFTFVSCEWEGSASDAGVLRSAISKGFSVPEGKFYLVDGGYANTPSYIAPYRGVRYHLSQFRRSRSSQSGYANYKELFNHRHAILRNHIERAIGVLKKRFPILKVGTFHPIENQIKIAAAAIAFHNIIRGQNGDEGWLDNQLDYISPSQYVDVPGGDNNYPNDTESSDGSTLRDQIALQMWAAYNS
ncbi:putative nuclease HARBI1 [Zea mays]|uniref:putative nuclease HARBI1 n=1 Tax=Zea mays TaxID=4577 RepID=UPI000220B83E|nr:putative nuclease HARBI1 [Zea mays]|eukprot:XP_020407825.1 putative nuclease HARBI1 [Zea mays]